MMGKKESQGNHSQNSLLENDKQAYLDSMAAHPPGYAVVPADEITISSVRLAPGRRVFKGLWKERVVAIKKIPSTTDKWRDWITFKEKFETYGRLNHPNIVMLLAICVDIDSYYLIGEYASRGSLRSLLRKPNHGLIPAQLWLILYDICAALSYIHEKNLVHGDIKPENIVITSQNRGQLIDFDLLMPVDTECVQGSVQYVPSELFQSPHKRTKQMDIYAVGMVGWEMFCGKGELPFSIFKHKDKALKDHIQSGGKEIIPETTPDEIKDFIESCWKTWRERPSAEELMARIQLLCLGINTITCSLSNWSLLDTPEESTGACKSPRMSLSS